MENFNTFLSQDKIGLILVKPELVRELGEEKAEKIVTQYIEKAGGLALSPFMVKKTRLTKEDIKKIWSNSVNQPWFPAYSRYMTSGECLIIPFLTRGVSAIQLGKRIVGSSVIPSNCEKGTLRHDYAKSDPTFQYLANGFHSPQNITEVGYILTTHYTKKELSLLDEFIKFNICSANQKPTKTEVGKDSLKMKHASEVKLSSKNLPTKPHFHLGTKEIIIVKKGEKKGKCVVFLPETGEKIEIQEDQMLTIPPGTCYTIFEREGVYNFVKPEDGVKIECDKCYKKCIFKEKLYDKSKELFNEYSKKLDSAHTQDHVKNLKEYLDIFIRDKYIIDERVLKASIFVHDIGRVETNKKEHAKVSEKLFRDFIEGNKTHGEFIPNKLIDRVAKIISQHELDLKDVQGLEATALWLIDKLDSRGYRGIYRRLLLAKGDIEKVLTNVKYKVTIFHHTLQSNLWIDPEMLEKFRSLLQEEESWMRGIESIIEEKSIIKAIAFVLMELIKRNLTHNIIAILLAGSAAQNEYIDEWSDIDLLIFTKTTSDYLSIGIAFEEISMEISERYQIRLSPHFYVRDSIYKLPLDKLVGYGYGSVVIYDQSGMIRDTIIEFAERRLKESNNYKFCYEKSVEIVRSLVRELSSISEFYADPSNVHIKRGNKKEAELIKLSLIIDAIFDLARLRLISYGLALNNKRKISKELKIRENLDIDKYYRIRSSWKEIKGKSIDELIQLRKEGLNIIKAILKTYE